MGARHGDDEIGPGQLEAEDAKAAVHRALDLGVTFFDTAQGYGWGESERTLAAALGDDLRREDVVVATKGGLRMEGGELKRDASPGCIRQGVEESLGCLGVEVIDLWQLHRPDSETPADETAGALKELRDEGKIRHVGAIVGARNPEQIEGTAPAGDIRLDDDVKAEIESTMGDAVGVAGPSPEGV
ncbi:MAG: aldo/keto reductase [Actinomycetota bacterium]|nr:aldo/keto reductase [Actinomycetota bacterium]MDQ3721304.1 aldo/keto reductase [Actinomycetota bacterium]